MPSHPDLLLAALRERDPREAEWAFARWALDADPRAVLELLPGLDEAETRRLGHAVYVGLAAGLLDRGAFAPVTQALADRVGIAHPFGDVREIWRPDRAFEVGRLRQRADEARRASAA